MIFYKIPLTADLSETSYRVFVSLDDCAFIEYNDGNIENDWINVTIDELISEYGFNPFERNEPQEEQEDNYEDLIQAELLLNQINIMAKQVEHDEVLAEILLNQLGV